METVQMDDVIANSFMDYHTKGFHYLCLKRHELHTIKIYVFDGDVSALPEVIAPHDHRYDFTTTCLTGCVENRWYKVSNDDWPWCPAYQRFRYDTPLNGGDGFTWRAEEYLRLMERKRFYTGDRYHMFADEIHTIQLRNDQTILRLDQYADKVPVGVPTSTWTLSKEPPSLSGLYRKPTADEVTAMFNYLRRLMPTIPVVV